MCQNCCDALKLTRESKVKRNDSQAQRQALGEVGEAKLAILGEAKILYANNVKSTKLSKDSAKTLRTIQVEPAQLDGVRTLSAIQALTKQAPKRTTKRTTTKRQAAKSA